jgi:nicotinate-nucleotide pyrophosphorylase (carboxylating)
MDRERINETVACAIAEDISAGDITTEALMPGDQQAVASVVVKQEGILAGIQVARRVFEQVDPQLKVEILLDDGAAVGPGSRVAMVTGSIASILKAERTSLNFLQHLSGVATETRRYVQSVSGLPVRIMDTRKTTPGLRSLQKYAVRVGGGHNHRMHLGDGILIKDNHIAALRGKGLSIGEVVTRTRHSARPGLTIEVEVATVSEALDAVEAGADIIMLDNMSLQDMRRAVQCIQGRALIEASGGITMDTVRTVAETGVDLISIGALTHSVRALDISLELEP